MDIHQNLGKKFTSISLLLNQAWQLKPMDSREHLLPTIPLDFLSYFTGRLAAIDKAHNLTGFKIYQSWQSCIANKMERSNTPSLGLYAKR